MGGGSLSARYNRGMAHRFKFIVALWALASASVMAQEGARPVAAETMATTVPAPETVKVLLQTNLGPILLLIEKERAPITAGNFLRYVDQQRLDGIGFYRAFNMDEAGNYGLVQAGPRGDPKKVLKPIAHEPTTVTGLSHISGAISMARLEPGTATAEFFIVLGDLPALDAQLTGEGDTLGYAVFGRVIDGMEVIRAILEQPRSATAGEGIMKGQMLEKPEIITTMRRAE